MIWHAGDHSSPAWPSHCHTFNTRVHANAGEQIWTSYAGPGKSVVPWRRDGHVIPAVPGLSTHTKQRPLAAGALFPSAKCNPPVSCMQLDLAPLDVRAMRQHGGRVSVRSSGDWLCVCYE